MTIAERTTTYGEGEELKRSACGAAMTGRPAMNLNRTGKLQTGLKTRQQNTWRNPVTSKMSEMNREFTATIEGKFVGTGNDEVDDRWLRNYLKEMLNEWRNEYPNVDLPVTGNKGARILSSYIMSSAALHCRTNEDGKVSPTEADLNNVKELFEDMFETLELEKYERKQSQKEGVASAIHHGIMRNIAEAAEGKDVSLPDEKKLEKHEQLVSIIETIGEDPTKSMEDVAKEVGVTRKTVYNRLNMELELDLENHYIDTYTALEGYRDGVLEIDPIVSNGRLTHLGKKVLHKLRDDDAADTLGTASDDDDSDNDDESDGGNSDTGKDDSGSDGAVEEDSEEDTVKSEPSKDNDEPDSTFNPDEGKVSVNIEEPIPAFMGVDLNEYGPYEAGEVAELPPENAKVLEKRGAAEPVKG